MEMKEMLDEEHGRREKDDDTSPKDFQGIA
jgi:hypothetical protein